MRIALAVVPSMMPEILVVLDEPSRNLNLPFSLNPKGKWQIIEIVRRLPQTKIIASHDLELVKALWRVIVMFEGGNKG